jgi:DNA-binding transcriptional MerR regulator
MKKALNILAVLFVTCVVSLGVASVFADDKPASPPNGAPGGGFDKMVQNLSEQGYDVAKIKAAVESGDNETAKKLLDTFFTEHPEAKPKRPVMSAEQLKTMTEELKQKGKDVSAIEAALSSGNTSAAQNLLDEFWKNNPDLRPTPKDPNEKPAQ